MEFQPPFIDVTYHREEYEFKELPSGLLEKKVVKRPGTVGICSAIQNKYQVDAIWKYLRAVLLKKIPRIS